MASRCEWSACPTSEHHVPANGSLILTVDRVCADGSMGSDAPSCIADMKLILGGKFLDNSESLEGMSRCPPLPPPPAGQPSHSASAAKVQAAGLTVGLLTVACAVQNCEPRSVIQARFPS